MPIFPSDRGVGEIRLLFIYNDWQILTFDPVPKIILVFVHGVDERHYIADRIAFRYVHPLVGILNLGLVFRVFGNFQYFHYHFCHGAHVRRPVVGGSYLQAAEKKKNRWCYFIIKFRLCYIVLIYINKGVLFI